ncbi:nucleotidyltransferase domain protein [Andreesenia angusta]|uniref:Nucleotidyltransferase domain protein n=1 Tax=Andreesenia angusta TaxID=39480 RepID=A0A1S1V4F3_9FIRM|nr:nucleotidyltransferase domain-containing protein [Andreesenia angusta]OHW61571.1 nucleotidyltransferase domain protein [Andreesenia angusta]
MKYGLSDRVLEQILSVLRRYDKVEKAVIYGSRAKGNYRPGSDIDITLFGKGLTILDLHNLEIMLDELYLPYSFDLSIFEKLQNEDLIDHINRVGKVIFDREKRV